MNTLLLLTRICATANIISGQGSDRCVKSIILILMVSESVFATNTKIGYKIKVIEYKLRHISLYMTSTHPFPYCHPSMQGT